MQITISSAVWLLLGQPDLAAAPVIHDGPRVNVRVDAAVAAEIRRQMRPGETFDEFFFRLVERRQRLVASISTSISKCQPEATTCSR